MTSTFGALQTPATIPKVSAPNYIVAARCAVIILLQPTEYKIQQLPRK